MNEVFHGSPSLLTNNEGGFVHALCYCCIPNVTCIKIPRNWPHKNNVYNFHCKSCGMYGIAIIQTICGDVIQVEA